MPGTEAIKELICNYTKPVKDKPWLKPACTRHNRYLINGECPVLRAVVRASEQRS